MKQNLIFKINYMIKLLLMMMLVSSYSCKDPVAPNFNDELAHPENVKAIFNAENESAYLTWDKVEKADGYTVWSSYSETSGYTLLADISKNEYTDTKIEKISRKFYKIKAYDTHGSSLFSMLVYVDNNLNGDILPTRYDFDSFDKWAFAHQDTATINQYRIADGYLFLRTRAQTYDRSKVYLQTVKLQAGKSSCRVFIPTMYANDQTSIASFLYNDDLHELDFEIGYGQAAIRGIYNAKPNEVVCYMTSQDLPHQSEKITLEMNRWYTLDIELTVKSNKYFVQWLVDGVVKSKLQLTYGTEIKFNPMLSLENLKFLGDHISKNNYEVKFDWLEITHYK